jgi:hypothetical protein
MRWMICRVWNARVGGFQNSLFSHHLTLQRNAKKRRVGKFRDPPAWWIHLAAEYVFASAKARVGELFGMNVDAVPVLPLPIVTSLA